MVPRRIVVLSLGGSLVVVGVLAWLGLPLVTQRPVSKVPLAVKSSAVASAPPVAALPMLPQFDTIRVEPSGESVVAGHGAPGAKIALLAGDKIIGQVQADKGSGDFVIVPKTLVPGDYVLALRSQAGAQAVQSRQTFTVSIPAKGQKSVVVALTEPGKASVPLADPTAQQASKPAVAQKTVRMDRGVATTPSVTFKMAEADRDVFFATGVAVPGTQVRIYLNASRLADVVADAAGHWSLTIPNGMIPGHYSIRADTIDAAGKVIARAEVPFDMPKSMIEAKLASADRARAASSQAVVEISMAIVRRGDSLWRISRKTFGRGARYTLIYAANAGQIRDPNLIYPGQAFVVPHPYY